MSNRFGSRLSVTIFGQSHAPAIGAVIDGLPAGIGLDIARIQSFLDRRAPGQSELATARTEADRISILSGLNERGQTCGAPLCGVIENGDARSADYGALRDVPRPGHADYAAQLKHGAARDVRGGGQFSGRLTAPMCFAGAVCQQLPRLQGVTVAAHLLSVGSACDRAFDPMGEGAEALAALRRRPLAALSDEAAQAMRAEILAAKSDGDSVGGVIELIAMGVPGGLGDPLFDGVENRIARALFAIPGVRGVEFGLGFAATKLRGSQHNDAIAPGGTETNRHGGALGGITSGMPIVVRAAMKPTPSIAAEQRSVSLSTGAPVPLRVTGRHDPCIAVRAVPVVEAAVWMALADMIL